MDLPVFLSVDRYRELADQVVLADVRWYADGRSGRAAYEDGHLPGAVHVDVDTDLSAPPVPGGARHPLPTPEDFADALGRLGIPSDVPVVAYDDASGSVAARLVWLLRRAGQSAAVLDGGVAAWDGALESGATTRDPVRRPVAPWPAERFTDADAVARGEQDVLLDARAHDRYTGAAQSPLDPRHGHVPGAVSLPWSTAFGPDGHLLPDEVLSAALTERGVDRDARVVAYCGSGVTACADLLVLEHLGVQDTRLYPGSWSEWGGSERPIATGERPTG